MAEERQERLKVKYYKGVTCRTVDWLWYPYIPYGKVTIIQGDPGQGKSTLALNLAAIVSTGGYIPLTDTRIPQSTVVYQNSEDGIDDTICPRLKNYGADLDRVAYIDETDMTLAMDDARLDQVLAETGARLMILDPIQAYFNGNTDMNRASGIRPVMSKLAKLAQKYNCAIVLIGHLSKAKGMNELYRGLGSIDIPAAARSVLLVSTMQDSPSERIMVQIKSNLAPLGASVIFRINGNAPIKWLRKSKITVEEIIEDASEPMTKEQRAEAIIYRLLKGGQQPSTVVLAECEKNGISIRTAKSAKLKMNIVTNKKKDGWYWALGKAASNSVTTEEHSDGE